MGEMVGSGLFLGGAVFAGIIFFAKDINTDGYIKLERNVFLRDSFFMLFSTLILLSLAITKHIYWWDGVLMLFLYLLYIVIVVFMGKSNTNSNDSQDTLVRNDFTLPRSLSDQPIFSNASDNIIISDSISERIKSNRPASIYSFRSFDNNFNSRRLYNLQSKLKRARYLIPSFPEAIKLWDQWNSLKNDISSDSTANDDSRIRRHAASISCRICHLAISNNNESRKQSASNYFKNRFIPKSFRNFVAILNCIYDVDFGLFYLAYFHHLFPIFDTFRNSSLFGKLTSVINMPAVFVLG